MTQGPHVKRLIAHVMSIGAVPSGGGFADALRFLMDPDLIKRTAAASTQWVEVAINAVRLAGEPNPWKTADDEAIAEDILRRIDEKVAARRKG